MYVCLPYKFTYVQAYVFTCPAKTSDIAIIGTDLFVVQSGILSLELAHLREREGERERERERDTHRETERERERERDRERERQREREIQLHAFDK
jgi:hypothetical protein